MNTRLAALAAAMLFPLSGAAWADGHAKIEELIAEAEVERDKARAVEFEWRYTSKHIEGAKKALAEGELEKAEELAEKALFEARTAQEQYEISEKNWILAVPQ